MNQPVIVETVRTTIGKMGGALREELVDFLTASVIEEVLERTVKKYK